MFKNLWSCMCTTLVFKCPPPPPGWMLTLKCTQDIKSFKLLQLSVLGIQLFIATVGISTKMHSNEYKNKYTIGPIVLEMYPGIFKKYCQISSFPYLKINSWCEKSVVGVKNKTICVYGMLMCKICLCLTRRYANLCY